MACGRSAAPVPICNIFHFKFSLPAEEVTSVVSPSTQFQPHCAIRIAYGRQDVGPEISAFVDNAWHAIQPRCIFFIQDKMHSLCRHQGYIQLNRFITNTCWQQRARVTKRAGGHDHAVCLHAGARSEPDEKAAGWEPLHRGNFVCYHRTPILLSCHCLRSDKTTSTDVATIVNLEDSCRAARKAHVGEALLKHAIIQFLHAHTLSFRICQAARKTF
mmetsp:Transcript_142591/g.251652  ORF Transcript_142591/g.251652 Transcript_142591/m.251652 type:complete len:216 (+) Transcript_142591:297-944(+)